MKTLSKTFNIIKSKAEKKLSLSQKTKTTAAKINNNAVNVPTGINIIPQSKENLHKTPILASVNDGGISEKMLNDELKAKIAAGAELPEVTNADNGDVLTVVSGAWDKAAPSIATNYVTNEQVIGTCENSDGTKQPLYRIMSVKNSEIVSNANNTINLDTSNIKNIYSAYGSVSVTGGYTGPIFPFSTYIPASFDSACSISSFDKINGTIDVFVGKNYKDASALTELFVIIEYSKTTDTAV